MPVIRKAVQIPDLNRADADDSAYETYGGLVGSMLALGIDFHHTDDKGFIVRARDGETRFAPNDWAILTADGIYKAAPAALDELDAGSRIVGFVTPHEADIFNTALTLRGKPKLGGPGAQVPLDFDPDPKHTSAGAYVVGTMYVYSDVRVWKVIEPQEATS